MRTILGKKKVKHEIGNPWYRIKVDGTKVPAGVENISTIIRFI